MFFVEKRERERGVGSPCSPLHHISQPSSHNYYHHLDLTLSTLVLCIYRIKIVLGNVQGYKVEKNVFV